MPAVPNGDPLQRRPLSSIIAALPDLHKAVLVILGTFSLAFSLGIATVGYMELPERIDEHDRRLAEHERRIEVHDAALDELRKTVELSNCLAIAQAAGGDYRECLDASRVRRGRQ